MSTMKKLQWAFAAGCHAVCAGTGLWVAYGLWHGRSATKLLSALTMLARPAHLMSGPGRTSSKRTWLALWFLRWLTVAQFLHQPLSQEYSDLFKERLGAGAYLISFTTNAYDLVALHGLLPGWALHVLALLIAVLIFTVGTTRVGIPLYTLATHLLIGVALPSLVARWLIARMTAQPAGPQSDSTVGRRTAPKVSTTDTQQPSEAASAEPEDAPSKPETAQRQGSVAQVPQQGSGEEAAATQSRAASAARCTGLVPYQSCLPGPFSLLLKIKAEMSGVSPGQQQNIVRRLVTHSEACGLQVRCASLRSGCIHITLHGIQIPAHPHTDNTPTATPTTRNDATQVARMLLPALRDIVYSHGVKSGELLRVQLGETMVSCYYTGASPNDDSWEVHAFPDAPSTSSPRNVRLGAVVPTAYTGDVGLMPADHSSAVSVSALDANTLKLRVQVWDLACAFTLGDGWQPLPKGEHATPVTPWRAAPRPASAAGGAGGSGSSGTTLPLQILVQCQGVYLPTRVQTLWQSGRITAAGVTIDVAEPAGATAPVYAHTESLALLQPLTLELWHGDTLIDTISALATPNASPAAAPGARTGWWGCGARSVAADAAAELGRLAARVAGEGETGEAAMVAHRNFIGDLCVWLDDVRRNAVESGQCIAASDAPAPLSAPPAPLSRALQRKLCTALQGFAGDAGMPALAAMLRRQSAALDAADAAAAPRPLTKVWYRVFRPPLMGYACAMCEESYRAWLRKYLAAMQCVVNGILCLLGISAISYARQREMAPFQRVLFLPWLGINTWAFVCCRRCAAAATAAAPLGTRALLRAGAYAHFARTAAKAFMVVLTPKVPQTVESLETVSSAFVFIIFHMIMSVAEQMRTVAYISASGATSVAMAEVVFSSLLTSHSPYCYRWVVLHLCCILLARMVTGAWLRSSGMWLGKAKSQGKVVLNNSGTAKPGASECRANTGTCSAH